MHISGHSDMLQYLGWAFQVFVQPNAVLAISHHGVNSSQQHHHTNCILKASEISNISKFTSKFIVTVPERQQKKHVYILTPVHVECECVCSGLIGRL